MNNLPPEKLILIASTIALNISKGKSLQEINAYKNLFSLISNNLQAITQQMLLAKKD